MEDFVQAIVGGGVALVGGLWMLELFAWLSLAWTAGLTIGLVGTLAILYGIWCIVDV